MYCKIRRLDLLRNGHSSDCELHVWYGGEQRNKQCCRQFRCHKIMLASASEVFASMIRHKDFERNNRILCVDDASPDAYETLLLYIYTYEIYNDITIEMSADLIYLTSKYKMPDFVEVYIGKLANQNWSMSAVLQIFQLANEHNWGTIIEVVGQKIVPVARQSLNDNSFLKFSVKELNALMVILKTTGIIPDKELLLALKKYQFHNELRYENMVCFQQFVEVTHQFDNVMFEADGTLVISDTGTESTEPEEPKGAEGADLQVEPVPTVTGTGSKQSELREVTSKPLDEAELEQMSKSTLDITKSKSKSQESQP
ncbi:uncharacterized protein LOC6567675 [Drosophila grimshawi]|uniref:GH19505 n=1 Tax=Drosophila grimshawi TaxID=7222 RepID=B4JRU4_DROGR|nr:uncharacterized protein LOC6567675 [Drosophila grimshawi]XP_032595792.1 uncharacterized protein LOC6567675 [Drosophila grimshawi]EDV94484.1 GH19505 [Drosophila grimshawi]